MSTWTDLDALRRRVKKEWDKGRILSARLTGDAMFPLRIPLKQPSPTEIGERFIQVKDWIHELASHEKAREGFGYELSWREVNHRQTGKNRIPTAAVFEHEEDALRFINKQRDACVFSECCQKIRDAFPELEPWLAKKPMTVLTHAGKWPRLLSVLGWLRDNPRPGIYIRQLEIPGIDTKFIEQHRKILAELLDIILPAAAIEESARGVSGFEERYGFLTKPARIRFRILDPAFSINGLSDLQIPAGDFADLDMEGAERVFIIENDINGLAFPETKRALVIFGLGYGLERLAKAQWLASKKIYYWGDIDTHGFAMLDQLRHHFPQTRSFLMDRKTLMAHKPLWGTEPAPVIRELPRLTAPESALYAELVQNRLARALRLEQERISYSHLKEELKKILPSFVC
jgi:hypothetical protein